MDSAKPCNKSTSGASGAPGGEGVEGEGGCNRDFFEMGHKGDFQCAHGLADGWSGRWDSNPHDVAVEGVSLILLGRKRVSARSQESNWCFCRRLHPWQGSLGRADPEYRARRYRASTSQAAPTWTT